MIPLDISGGGERCGAVLTNEDIVYHSGIPIVISKGQDMRPEREGMCWCLDRTVLLLSPIVTEHRNSEI